jgi:hypothetical protein
MIASGQNYIEICMEEGNLTHISFDSLAEKGLYIYNDGTIVLSNKGFAGPRMHCDKGTWVIYDSQNGHIDRTHLKKFQMVEWNGLAANVYVYNC